VAVDGVSGSKFKGTLNWWLWRFRLRLRQ